MRYLTVSVGQRACTWRFNTLCPAPPAPPWAMCSTFQNKQESSSAPSAGGEGKSIVCSWGDEMSKACNGLKGAWHGVRVRLNHGFCVNISLLCCTGESRSSPTKAGAAPAKAPRPAQLPTPQPLSQPLLQARPPEKRRLKPQWKGAWFSCSAPTDPVLPQVEWGDAVGGMK